MLRLLSDGDVLQDRSLLSVDFRENVGNRSLNLVELHHSGTDAVGHSALDVATYLSSCAVGIGEDDEAPLLRYPAPRRLAGRPPMISPRLFRPAPRLDAKRLIMVATRS